AAARPPDQSHEVLGQTGTFCESSEKMSKSTETASLPGLASILVLHRDLRRRWEDRLTLSSAEVGMSDAELVRRACEGARTAQEQLARRYAPRLLAVCRARIGRHEAVEDLAQEALLRGLTH